MSITAAARRIFITVAEVSGDQHAAQLIIELKKLEPELVIEGMGGARMREAGCNIHHETVRSAAIGTAAIARIPEVVGLLRWTRRWFKTHPPTLHICCDSWGLNSYFARLARDFDIPVLYYIAPQTWASREGRVKKLAMWVDQLACILPFEQQYFRDRGVAATFVGHPLFDELPSRTRLAPYTGDRPPVVGLLPGSRQGEAKKNFPSMLAVAADLRIKFPGVRFLVPSTPGTDPIVRRLMQGLDDVEVSLDAFDSVVSRCDVCLTVSGTATLHVAGHGVPMVVVYRASPLMWHALGRWVIRTRTFALVNLLSGLDRHIVPEFVPWTGPVDAVTTEVEALLTDPARREAQTTELARLIQTLDRPGASANVAKMAMEMIERQTARRADGQAVQS
jgi:lipid-A-disaccharide synthase